MNIKIDDINVEYIKKEMEITKYYFCMDGDVI